MYHSSPPAPICMQVGDLNFILETRTSKCGQCLGWRSHDCRVEEYTASLLPACGSSTMCTLRAFRGWFLCHQSTLDYVWKHWMSKITACVGRSLLRAVETGVKLILALRSAPSLFSLQQCSGSCQFYTCYEQLRKVSRLFE